MAESFAPNPNGEEGFRGPDSIFLTNCSDITTSGITITRVANYGKWFSNCSKAVINEKRNNISFYLNVWTFKETIKLKIDHSSAMPLHAQVETLLRELSELPHFFPFPCIPNTKVVKLSRLRGDENGPFVYFESYFHPRIGITPDENFQQSLYELLEQKFKVVPVTSREKIKT